MDTSLTTFDGYPRDDIDVAQSTIPHPLSRHTLADSYLQFALPALE